MHIKKEEFKFIQGWPVTNLIHLTSLILFLFYSEGKEHFVISISAECFLTEFPQHWCRNYRKNCSVKSSSLIVIIWEGSRSLTDRLIEISGDELKSLRVDIQSYLALLSLLLMYGWDFTTRGSTGHALLHKHTLMGPIPAQYSGTAGLIG